MTRQGNGGTFQLKCGDTNALACSGAQIKAAIAVPTIIEAAHDMCTYPREYTVHGDQKLDACNSGAPSGNV